MFTHKHPSDENSLSQGRIQFAIFEFFIAHIFAFSAHSQRAVNARGERSERLYEINMKVETRVVQSNITAAAAAAKEIHTTKCTKGNL
jgi:hypothetical protein